MTIIHPNDSLEGYGAVHRGKVAARDHYIHPNDSLEGYGAVHRGKVAARDKYNSRLRICFEVDYHNTVTV